MNDPILNARLQEIRAETRTSLMSLESKLNASAEELKADTRRSHAQLEAKIDRRLGDLDAKIDRRFGALETRMDRTELFRWGCLLALVNVALTVGVPAVLHTFTHLR